MNRSAILDIRSHKKKKINKTDCQNADFHLDTAIILTTATLRQYLF